MKKYKYAAALAMSLLLVFVGMQALDQYDTIFIGCPVWWHTAHMAVRSFLENEIYDFSGKTIIPFCTYEATFKDETLANIVELTPRSKGSCTLSQ